MSRHDTRTHTLTLWLAIALGACHRHRHAGGPNSEPAVGRVALLTTPTGGARHEGRAGDLSLVGSEGTSLTLASTPDAPGHRPLRGSIIDIAVASLGTNHADPLVWWRAAWFDTNGVGHPLVADDVSEIRCGNGSAGVKSVGSVDGVGLETTICAASNGRYTLTTHATSLPPGAMLGDEVNVGNSAVGVDGHGETWSGETVTPFVTVAERGIALALEAPPFAIRRDPGADRDDLSRVVLQARYSTANVAMRTLHVVAGDALTALARLQVSTRAFVLRGHARGFDLRDAAGEVLFTGELPERGGRLLRLPPQLGTEVLFRDDRGVPAAGPIPLTSSTVFSPEIARTTLELAYTDDRQRSIPVHVLFRGLQGTPDPEPRIRGRGYHAGRSVYLLDGRGEVSLSPGRYRITASHGIRYSLDVREVDLAPHADIEIVGLLREVVRTPDWTSADFHLHAAPSPDSRVSLPERVAALYCEGVDFAVATDHNRVTDYIPALEQLGIRDALGTLPGEEVTTFAPNWGHFIAYPMALGGERSSGIVPFYETTPARIFADARARGAQVIQVNHGRMHPTMGYFDFTHLDPATGRADPSFAGDFDAVEAFNGWYIEHPAEVRIGAQDLVALARRGMHPTATGNSDSHMLLYEEAGYPRTYVQTPREPAATLAGRIIDAVLHGRTTVSAGPFVEIHVGGAGPGAIVRPDANGRLVVHVRVSAPAWVPVERIEVWVDDVPARTFPIATPPIDGVRFDQDVDLVLNRDAVILAWADARTPLPDVLPYPHAIGIGFTGLVYVDADGDGRISVAPRALAH